MGRPEAQGRRAGNPGQESSDGSRVLSSQREQLLQEREEKQGREAKAGTEHGLGVGQDDEKAPWGRLLAAW